MNLKSNKMKMLVLLISFILILIVVTYIFLTENDNNNLTNIEVSIQMQNKSYNVGQNISGNLTLFNGNNKTIYLLNVPSYEVDILSNETLQSVWSYDYPSIEVLRKVPILAHSSHIIYNPCDLYFSYMTHIIPPGNYTIEIKVRLTISLDNDVKNAVNFLRTTQTFVEIQ
jgi:hypothetical protein